jgi:hypothetical protein
MGSTNSREGNDPPVVTPEDINELKPKEIESVAKPSMMDKAKGIWDEHKMIIITVFVLILAVLFYVFWMREGCYNPLYGVYTSDYQPSSSDPGSPSHTY